VRWRRALEVHVKIKSSDCVGVFEYSTVNDLIDIPVILLDRSWGDLNKEIAPQAQASGAKVIALA
jgi:hypothetical protein